MTLLQAPAHETRSQALAVLGLVFTSFIWGSLIPLIGALRGVYDPMFILLVRYLPAQPVLLLAALVIERKLPYATNIPWLRIALLSSAGLLGFSSLHTIGILFSDPIWAAVVTSFGPITTAVVAKLLDGVNLPRGLVAAISCAVGGGILVAANGDLPVRFYGGEFLLIASQVCWTWYSLRAQSWLATAGLTQLQVTAVTSGMASLLLTIAYVALVAAGQVTLPTVNLAPAHVVTLLWIGVAGTGVGLVTWNAAVKRLGVPIAALYLNLIPVFAMAIVAAYGATLSLLQIAGGVLVIAGVLQMQLRRLKA